jgi:hypothetical protein
MENFVRSVRADAVGRLAGFEDGEYVAPQIQTFSPQEFLDLLGPAQGYGGGMKPPSERGGNIGRTPRLIPGIR